MIKLVLINHTFQKKDFYKRWQKLAEAHQNLDVTLLAPGEWDWGIEKNLTYGHVDHLAGETIESNNFRIHLIDIQKTKLGGWISYRMETEILQIHPDFVYYIGEHTQDALMQLFRFRKRNKLNTMKILAFSMRGHQQSLHLQKSSSLKGKIRSVGKYLYFKRKLDLLNRNCDVIFCHYPDAMAEFRREGFRRPIYMQTQVGVDPDIFHPDEACRRRIREQYSIGDAFLFGSASRFNENKGLNEIIKALPEDGNWKYLMMGWGRPDEVERIKSEIAARHLEEKIILTGFIDNWPDMAAHWNALDCAVHAPLTTHEWEETFSLALVQAMATGLPIIGSSSGSVPYQIGPKGVVIREKDIQALHDAFIEMMLSPEKCRSIGDQMKDRAVNGFGIYHLNELFYLTIKDIMNGIYDPNKIDMANYNVEGS